MKTTFGMIALIVLTSILTACGGGGGGGSSTPPVASSQPAKSSSSASADTTNSSSENSSSSTATISSSAESSAKITELTQTGYLLDSALINVNYQTTSHTGVTGADGDFYYELGETVTFNIGDLHLGTVAGQPIVTPLTLTNSATSTTQAVRNMARLLQTLDKDANPSNGINITNTAKSAAVALDWNTPSTSFDSAALSLVSNAGQDQPTMTLVDAEQALEHLNGTLTQVNSCPGARQYRLKGTDVVVQSRIKASDSIHITPLTGTLNVSAEAIENGVPTGSRTCVLAASEGYNFDSNICLLYNGQVTFHQSPPLVRGTVARNSVTLFIANGGTGSDYGREVVDAYFFGAAQPACATEEVAPGNYPLNGVEYVFTPGAAEAEASWQAYAVSGQLTLDADTCKVTSTEGSWDCKVVGNDFYGLGNAGLIRGTITNTSVTYVIKYNTGENGETFYGYGHGERQ